ncbi:MAG TPA: amidohydrolase family protein [Acidimicrobiales bacterium]|nr:amidohydrolase family protein [Acidimicrobiales bacterium]
MTIQIDQVQVIDTDTHLTEPHDLWTGQAPASMIGRMPHVADVDGTAQWVIDDQILGRAGGGGVIGRDGAKVSAQKGLFEWTIDDIHQGAYDPAARLEMMDAMGIWAEVLYPNVIGLGGQGIADVVKDEPFRLLLLQMYNDHMLQLQERSGTRLIPMGVLLSWSVDACVAEAQRLSDLEVRGVNMTSDPQDLGSPDLGSRAWDPLWAACSDLELPVHFHIGASLTTMNFYGNYPWPSQHEDVALGIGGTLLFVGNARVVVNVICSGLLDRFPNLKMVSVESGCGWIPFILEALDYEMAENAPHLADELSLRPSEYFKRQMYATTWFERKQLASVVEAVGEDNIMFETDFPHPTCLFPDPLETAARNMVDLTPEVQRKILSENAVRLYRL